MLILNFQGEAQMQFPATTDTAVYFPIFEEITGTTYPAYKR